MGVEKITIRKTSELSMESLVIIETLIQDTKGEIEVILGKMRIAIGGNDTFSTFKNNGALLKDLNSVTRERVTIYHNQVISILMSLGIVFIQPPKLATTLQLLDLLVSFVPYKHSTEHFEIFFHSYGGKFVFEENLKTTRNRVISMQRAISWFNKHRASIAGFRLVLKHSTDIITHFGLDKRLHTDPISGLPYASKGQIKGLLRGNKTLREELECSIKEFGWQKGWKHFAISLNNEELAKKRGFLLQKDIRQVRDILDLATIDKAVIIRALY